MDLFQRAIENGFTNEPSQADIEKITNHLKEFKISNNRPDSLEQLAIKCIIDNRSQFRVPVLNPIIAAAGSNNNPFEVLSRGPAEKLLSAALDKKVNVKTEKLYLILQLLNGQVTEFDSSRLKQCDRVLSADAMFFRHMLQNCPKIKKAHILPSIWRNFCILPRTEHQELLSVMATCWPNLTSLSLDLNVGGHLEGDLLSASGNNTVETICINLPNLSFLKVTFDRREILSARDCEMLAKMNQLKSLHLLCSDTSDIKLAENVAHAAGRVPFLERFSFSVKKSTLLPMGFQSSSFIVLYSQLYPHKNLILEKHTMSMNHSGSWPSCLSVEELVIIGDSQQFDMSSCCNVRSLKTIDTFLPLLKSMGANLNSLSLVSSKSTVDLLPIFTLCPRLKELSIRAIGSVEESMYNNLKPSQLSQLTNFKFISSKAFPSESCQVSNLYTKYLLTSRNSYETYQVQSVSELRAIVRVLREEERSCFDQLRDIQFFCNPRLGDEKDALRVIGMLMLRSPHLKTVAVTSTQYHGLKVPDWFKKIMSDVGVACVPTFQPSESDLWGQFDPYESYDDLSDDDDIDDDDDDEEDAIGFSYDSDGNPTFEDIQGYLMWRDGI